MSNFIFLSKNWPVLAELGELAEKNLHTDSNTTLIKLRIFSEVMVKYVLAYENLEDLVDGKQISRLNLLGNKGIIPDRLVHLFHGIRKIGNKATHEAFVSVESAENCLRFAYHLAVWFKKTYEEDTFLPASFTLPQKEIKTDDALTEYNRQLSEYSEQLEKKYEKLHTEFENLKTQEVSKDIKKARRKRSTTAAKKINLTESETRQLIDQQLIAAGWEADTINFRYAKGTRPEKFANKAIAEWPTSSGHADYALFCGMTLIGVIEAKKKQKDVVSDLGQAKRYAKDVEIKESETFARGYPWGEYNVPFLFSTNGRPYLKQLEQKSGIWILDARGPTNHPRPLQAWYTPQGLQELLKQDKSKTFSELIKEPFDYLGLRDFQIIAIEKIEQALENNKQSILLAMATGTGKTRTAIGLIYRLIKSERFRRILFLVDRNALGEQAEDAFKETKLEDLLTFDQIFDLQGIGSNKTEETTRAHISTVQGIIHRIMFNADDSDIPTIDQYDCIVVDEAHRGYTLDKELGEVELLYRDEKDYISKYRKVLEYFDAVKIGMTATPAPHTADIFGKPVFTYGYREAVIDGWLIDHEPPHQFTTKLAKKGITWKKGETVPVYDPATGEVTNLENIPDEITLEIDHFNKSVITEKFNRTIIKELIKYLDPEGDEKTLIFASTDNHADLVVKILHEEFENVGVEVDDDAIEKITGSIDRPLQMIKKYKNEKYPNIAVTVDLLTTGVDVPEICNLVFIRRVRSRILYEQMMGRATRICDNIKKEHFNIFDAVGIYEALEPVTNMKPVSPNPTITLQTLVEELFDMENQGYDAKHQKQHIGQLISKLRRKARILNDDQKETFETLSGGESIEVFIQSIKDEPVKNIKKILKGKQNLLSFLDENKYLPKKQFISDHEDELTSHTRGYGKGEKPEDFLNEFKEFIIDNMNKISTLAIVCKRPRELTRASLRQLKIELDKHGFTEPNLKIAWREWKNEDIAADIISFIRRLTLGDPLVSHEERIKEAMKKVYALEDWTKIQRKWLEQIERQLIAETIVNKEDLEKGAFKAKGGFNKLNKIFRGKLINVLDKIKKSLYPDEKKYG
ncbi:MAG: type I restriction-modification system endonuclease [Desulfobacterales bacterium]|nr:type I restriction-modification system endonuclease [Desulfobacterales bacterium]